MATNEILTAASESRRTDTRWLLIIFAVLVALIAVPAWLWTRHESNRPTLAEARVVSATSTDPVFREGVRSVAAHESVQLALAIRLEQPGRDSRWLAPVEELVLDGIAVAHDNTDRWPEQDRVLRVFWFTLEAPFLGGQLDEENVASKLAYQPFFAPELGRGLMADGEPEAHADDGVNLGDELVEVTAGTYRVYARVEIVTKASSSHPLHVATSLAADALADPRLPRISRRLDPGLGLDPRAGELFRLPGFETESKGVDMQELADRRLATSSEVFACTAVNGTTRFEPGEFETISSFRWQDGRITMQPHPWRWASDVRTGDILRQGKHWLVLVADDGDGVLGPNDVVAHVWRRPAALLALGSALADDPADLELLRPLRVIE